jgi:predicted aldo/keto reductase-like oxidoreductase
VLGQGIVPDSVADMPIMTRTLGRTGADATILGYGAMELRGRPRGPEISDQDAGRVLNAVLDGGINLIDTSKLVPSRHEGTWSSQAE